MQVTYFQINFALFAFSASLDLNTKCEYFKYQFLTNLTNISLRIHIIISLSTSHTEAIALADTGIEFCNDYKWYNKASFI